MESAITRYQTDVAVQVGRTLLALADDFPPQLFLDLGEQLLLTGRVGEAEGAFARAIDGPDEAAIVPKMADLFAQYGYAERARHQLQSLLRRHPFDADPGSSGVFEPGDRGRAAGESIATSHRGGRRREG